MIEDRLVSRFRQRRPRGRLPQPADPALPVGRLLAAAQTAGLPRRGARLRRRGRSRPDRLRRRTRAGQVARQLRPAGARRLPPHGGTQGPLPAQGRQTGARTVRRPAPLRAAGGAPRLRQAHRRGHAVAGQPHRARSLPQRERDRQLPGDRVRRHSDRGSHHPDREQVPRAARFKPHRQARLAPTHLQHNQPGQYRPRLVQTALHRPVPPRRTARHPLCSRHRRRQPLYRPGLPPQTRRKHRLETARLPRWRLGHRRRAVLHRL